jgi:uncharacterized membrane protein
MTPPAPPAKKRIEFIDLLRGWAVIVMIQTHIFNSTLRPEIMESVLYDVIKFIDGLVAPTFLFASGMAYAVATRRKVNDYLSFGTPLLRQIGRLSFILLIAYLLHVPRFNYHHLRYEAGATAWQIFWQSDVLQCIAVTLLLLQALLLILRSEQLLYRVVLVCSVGIVFATPIMWGIDFWQFWPVPLASFMNGLHYSIFPLFPWAAFLFAGALTGRYYLHAKDGETAGVSGAVDAWMKRTAGAAGGLILVSFAFHPIARLIYPVYDYWGFSPSFFMLRLGIVLMIMGGMYLAEKRWTVAPSSVITLMGRESLLVYASHLFLIYGRYSGTTFTEIVKHSFGYPEAVAATTGLLLLMLALAYAWSNVKKGPPALKWGIEGAILLGFALFFYYGPN